MEKGTGWTARMAEVALAALLLLSMVLSAQAQFSSGSSGTHGAFPPAPTSGMPSSFNYLVWNVRSGTVRYCTSYTRGTGVDQCDSGSSTNVSAQIPNIPAGGLTSGVYEFTDFTFSTIFGAHRSLVLVGTSSNRPLTVLSQGDITINGNSSGYTVTFYADGSAGGSTSTNFSVVGGRGGPGGFDGGASGNGGTSPGNGSSGFGPAGGAGGRADGTTLQAVTGSPSAASPLNPSLTPLGGGSGGGGGAGVAPTNSVGCGSSTFGYGGGGGAGGGGALLLAASGQVTIGQYATVDVRGGNGGRQNTVSCGLWGGGGAGGSLRIVAQQFAGQGTLNLGGGTQANGAVPAAGGQLRIESAVNTFNGTISGAAGGSFLSFPTAPIPGNQATLRITSIGGISTPSSPQAALTAPDITFPSAVQAPVTLSVAASNIPVGTPVNLKIVPAVGEPTTAVTAGLSGSEASSTAQGTVTIPPGAGIVTASASFTLSGTGAALGPLTIPVIDGERPQRVEVVAEADGVSRTYLVARSGARFELGQVSR